MAGAGNRDRMCGGDVVDVCQALRATNEDGVMIRIIQVTMLNLVIVVTVPSARCQTDDPHHLDLPDATRHEVLRLAATQVSKDFGFVVPLTPKTRLQVEPVQFADIPGFDIGTKAGRTFFIGSAPNVD